MLKPIRGAQLNRVYPTVSYLMCHLFNEGTGNKTLDLSGNGNNGSLLGSNVGWGATAEGFAARLNPGDTATDFVAFDQKAISFASGEDFCLHVRFRTTDNEGALVALRSSASSNPIAALMVGYNGITTSAGKLLGIFRDDGGSLAEMATTISVDDGMIHTATFRRAGFYITVFVDGIEGASAWSAPSSVTFTANRQALGAERGWIADSFSTPDRQYLDADILYYEIKSGTVFDSEITQLHLNPYAMFDAGISPAMLYVAAGGLSIPVAMHHYRQQGIL